MIAASLIYDLIPPLKPSDSLLKAQQWMQEFRVTQLPVVSVGKYLGLLSEDTLLDAVDSNASVSTLSYSSTDLFVYADKLYLEVVKYAADKQLQVIPVLDRDDNYIGIVSMSQLSSQFTNMILTQDKGDMIVLSMRLIDYSLAEVSRLVEENGAKIMTSFIAADIDHLDNVILTLKLNSTENTRIIAALTRYGYTIVNHSTDFDALQGDQDRLDQFMRYLSV
jgi:acetoin utilization protein AcuB